MIAPELPAAIKVTLEHKAYGLSRNDAATRVATMSRTYRDGGNSSAIRSEADALAYALARMPATYAAVAASLNALNEVRPDFAPQTLLDAGAGPGTASWAATQAYASLTKLTLLDANAALKNLALEFAAASDSAAHMQYEAADVRSKLADMPSADLVLASYMIGELDAPARAALADTLWQKTRDTLLIVEPGTPAGYERIIALRAQLIAHGAHVIAPCPHDRACPLTKPDWCHFTQRLARSRAHKHLKGAELPFEDEKFSYVALSRTPPVRRPARVLAQPEMSKVAIRAKLCTAAGLEVATAPRRDKAAYARFRRLDWGDAIFATPEHHE
ncbi:MAG TPA: small ribosomal subunit Rsm22 family protein [Xanthobacteraceae bacterium]|jgi:ribosomal protein RSM22 (predicted rRNA methylase)